MVGIAPLGTHGSTLMFGGVLMLGRIHMGLIICCIVGCIHDWTPFEEAVLEDMGVGLAPPAPSESADEVDVDEALSFTARGPKF